MTLKAGEGRGSLITLDEVRRARNNVRDLCSRTPQWRSAELSRELGCEVQLKLELLQHSGSFKARGCFHQMLSLGQDKLAQGVVAVSGGNFARSVGYCSGVLGVDAIVCMPENAPQGSIDATRAYGAGIELLPDAAIAFQRADEWVARGRTSLHPFDSRDQIAGNGIVALEILEDCPALTDIVVSIGGGGLIAGIIAAIKASKPSARVWGVEPELAPTMQRALAAGQVVNISPSSLSKTLGGPFVGETALALCREHLEDLILVSDLDMIAAQRRLMEGEKVFAELAAASTLAAADRIKGRLGSDAQLVLLICGGNDSLAEVAGYHELLESAQGV